MTGWCRRVSKRRCGDKPAPDLNHSSVTEAYPVEGRRAGSTMRRDTSSEAVATFLGSERARSFRLRIPDGDPSELPPCRQDHRLEESRMEPITPPGEATPLGARVTIDIEEAGAGIAEEIAGRGELRAHLHGAYQVICSADRQCIWIASAVGLCMDPRYTPLEIHAAQTWTWNSADLEDDLCDIGWRTSTPAAIVDLLEETLAGGSAPGVSTLQ